MSILVVDDDAMNLRMTEVILTKKGYEVKKADSGQAALALLQSEKIELVPCTPFLKLMPRHENKSCNDNIKFYWKALLTFLFVLASM